MVLNMLYIGFKKTKKTISDIDAYWEYNYEEEWFKDDFIKKMVKSVDKSKLLNSGIVKSPALGIIPHSQLSRGVRALILLYKEPDIEIWASTCGDNCAEWILKIGEMRDIHIVLEHVMHFNRDFKAICVNDGKEINCLNDYRDCLFKYLTS